MLIFLDNVLDSLGDEIAAHEPERGGALLGFRDSNVVCNFLADPEARISRSSYFPSQSLLENVQRVERETCLVLCGVVHSHPGTMNQPSRQDHRAFALGLALNPHVARFVAPIITVDRTAADDDTTQVTLSPRGRMTAYVALRKERSAGRPTQSAPRPHRAVLNYVTPFVRRSTEYVPPHQTDRSEDDVSVLIQDIGILPVHRDSEILRSHLIQNGHTPKDFSHGFQEINGAHFISVLMSFEEFELLLLFPTSYPLSPTVALLTRPDSQTHQLKHTWTVTNEHFRLQPVFQSIAEHIDATSSDASSLQEKPINRESKRWRP